MKSTQNYPHSPRTAFYLASVGAVVVVGTLTACGVHPVLTGVASIALGGIPVIVDVKSTKAKEAEDAEIKKQLAEIREQLKFIELVQKQLTQGNK